MSGVFFVNECIDWEVLCEQWFCCLFSLEVLVYNFVVVSVVEVEILDINDNLLCFLWFNYQFQVSELVVFGVCFYIESVQDFDVGVNLVQIYEFSFSEYFELDFKFLQENSKVFELVLCKGLDWEQVVLYYLVFIVVDGGILVCLGMVQIFVCVLDINDNFFVFDQFIYCVQLWEDLFLGILVVKLNVLDLDEGFNGEFRYFLSSYMLDWERQFFSIDVSIGEV